MQDLTYLIAYLVIAAAIVGVLNLRYMGPIRRLFDKGVNATTSDLDLAKRFSEIGERRAFETSGRTSKHQVTRGLRVLATGLTICALWYWLGMAWTTEVDGMTIQSNPPSFLTIALVLVIVGYYLIYIWTYEVQISDTDLIVPTYHLTKKRYDLTKLRSIEDDGAYMFRLYFHDGKRAEVLKYVTGPQSFRTRLEQLAQP